MFNNGWDAAKIYPPYISSQTVAQLAAFLAEGVRDAGASELMIDFHGGEPLMVKKDRFDEMCQTFLAATPSTCEVKLRIQTNAILVDDEWIALFKKYNVHIGVSLDGPAHVNDRFRVGPKGEGTHAKTVAGLRLLQTANAQGRVSGVGLLSVATTDTDAKEVYDHFISELGDARGDSSSPIATGDASTKFAVRPNAERPPMPPRGACVDVRRRVASSLHAREVFAA